MKKVCVILLGVAFSIAIIKYQNVIAQGFEDQAIKVKQEIGRLENEARETEERIKTKLQAQAPAIEIKELEQKGWSCGSR